MKLSMYIVEKLLVPLSAFVNSDGMEFKVLVTNAIRHS